MPTGRRAGAQGGAPGAQRARWTTGLLVTGLLVAFTAHNLEELVRYESGALGPGPRWSETYAADRFAVAVVLLTAAVTALLLPVVRSRTPRAARAALLATGALLGNVVSHVAQVVVLRSDSPGVVTAVLLVLPVAVLVARHLLPTARTGRAGAAALLVAGALLAIPAILGSLALGRAIAG